MSHRTDALSRSKLIGGMFAGGMLAACGGGVSTTVISSGAGTIAPNCSTVPANSGADRFGVNEIFSDQAFNALDKEALLAAFDPSGNLDVLHQGYLAQLGQQVQSANVITQIPSTGLVIQSPGTYAFGRNILWSPNNVTSSAITIQASNVTLDLAGFSLTAAVSDKSRQISGIVVAGSVTNIAITNGTVAGISEYGVLAKNVCGLNISRITVTGVCMQNLGIRFLTPAGIQVSNSDDVAISGCSVTQLGVTTDSSAGIQLIGTSHASVSGCSVGPLVNNDGAVQGFSYIGCTNVTTTGCTANSLQSHFNGNVLTSGHTVLGFCPIFCQHLSYVNCSASGLTGCCDDCHGMSVFLDAQITVSGFRATQIVDGVSPSNSGAKATGLEVYGAGVTVIDSVVSDVKAINPQDKQAAGFSAWGAAIQFQRCAAGNVTVQDDLGGSRGTGFGWAPDPRPFFRKIGAFAVTYTDCKADRCDVGFDTWFHVDSSWIRPVYTNCGTGILVEPGGARTVSGDPCSECSPPITVTLTNFAGGNTYPH
jgi:hypothetical protein